MAHILGTPYKGVTNAAVIQSYERGSTDIEEGLAVTELTNVTIKQFAGGAEIPVGVMAGTEHKGRSAVLVGIEVFVQVAAAVNAIAVTDKVYVDATGKFTNVSEGNTQVNATWVADASGATLWNDGVVKTGANKRVNQKCGMISFRGGF